MDLIDRLTSINIASAEDVREVEDILKCLSENCQPAPDEVDLDGKRDGNFRERIPATFFPNLKAIVEKVEYQLDLETENSRQQLRNEFQSHLFRLGRTIVVHSPRNQELMTESGLITLPLDFLRKSIEIGTGIGRSRSDVDSNESRTVCIRLALQMVYNCMFGNDQIIRKLVHEFEWFVLSTKIMLSHEDEKVIQYSSANAAALLNTVGLSDVTKEPLLNILKGILSDNGRESMFPIKLWLSSFLSTPELVSSIYYEVEEDCRADLLNAMITHELELNAEVVNFFQSHFIQKSTQIISSDLVTVDTLISSELSCLIQFFCYLCGTASISLLHSDVDFVNAGFLLLKTVHLAGKLNEENPLTPLDTLSSGPDLKAAQTHPTYLFKSNLIRLVGNLSYRHRTNQDKARELEILPVILECTKIETRNPFIPQCSIFAIKCLLEANVANQEFVKSVSATN